MEQEIDLFESYETLPAEVKEVLFSFEDETYEECERLLSKLEPLGYTFDYYLDASPYNLRKITKE
jgi:hypothetical protein